METWNAHIWTALIIAFVVGGFVGYFLVRSLNSNVKKQIALETQLKEAEAKLQQQSEKIEQHFKQSAEHLSQLALNYKQLYSHFADNAQALLPQDKNLDLFKPAQLEQKEATSEDDQPRDYSEGSSGLLKS